MTDLPQPLTPADCDLRKFPFMPLDAQRLRDSDIASLSSGDEFRCAVLLWCAAWHQIPAGSIPDDDKVLSKLSGFGFAVKEWQKCRDGALRGWIKCSDGRLYHPIVCEKALEGWAGRVKHAEKKKADAERKAEERRLRKLADDAKLNAQIPPDTEVLSAGQNKNVHRTDSGNPQEFSLKGKGDKDSGQWTVDSGQLTSKALSDGATDPEREDLPQDDHPHAAPLPPREDSPESYDPAIAMAVALRKLGVNAQFTHPAVQDWITREVPMDILHAAVAKARETKGKASIPPNYLVGIVEELLHPPAKAEARPIKPQGDDWFRSREGIERKARELKVFARNGESHDGLKDRLFAIIRKQGSPA